MAAPATLRRSSDRQARETGAVAQMGPARAMPGWKRALDVSASSLGLVLLAPLFVVVAVVIALDSPGGPVFRQVRVGKGGRHFVCWKFRTMRRDADALKVLLMDRNEARGHIFKLKDDPRRTRVGIFLRKTSIDELPQLWNVLRGDMSLVGPRPPVPAEVSLYGPGDLRRLAVEPGITGLWQVTLRGRHDFEDMVELDVEYVRRRSFALDMWILLRTIGAVVRGEGSC